MTDKVYEPRFQQWCEQQFSADAGVRRMVSHDRLMYRSLLQGAFWCSTRPDLPDDDQVLCDLADADSMEHWLSRKDIIMKRFFTLENGVWWNKHLRRDWQEREGEYLAKVEAGRAGGLAKAAKAKRVPSDTMADPNRPLAKATIRHNIEDRTVGMSVRGPSGIVSKPVKTGSNKSPSDPVSLISVMFKLLGEPKEWIGDPDYANKLTKDARKALEAGSLPDLSSALEAIFSKDSELSDEFLNKIVSATHPMAMFATCAKSIMLKTAALKRQESKTNSSVKPGSAFDRSGYNFVEL